MKRFLTSGLMLCLVCSLTFAQSFEGTITATHSLRPNVSTEFLVKGDQTRQTPVGPGLADMKVYTDLGDNAYYLWTNHQGNIRVLRYFLTGSSRQASGSNLTFANITATGNTQTIDGYVCEEYTGTVDGTAFTAWAASDLDGLNLQAHISPQTFEQLPYASLPGVEGLILQFNSTHASSNQSFTATLSVLPHSVDPALVENPVPTVLVD